MPTVLVSDVSVWMCCSNAVVNVELYTSPVCAAPAPASSLRLKIAMALVGIVAVLVLLGVGVVWLRRRRQAYSQLAVSAGSQQAWARGLGASSGTETHRTGPACRSL